MTASTSLLALLGVAGAVFVSLRGIRLTRRDLSVPAMSGLAAVLVSGAAQSVGLSMLAAWFGAALFAYVFVLEAHLDAAREPRSRLARRLAAAALSSGAVLASAPLTPEGLVGAAACWLSLMIGAAAATSPGRHAPSPGFSRRLSADRSGGAGGKRSGSCPPTAGTCPETPRRFHNRKGR